MRWMKEGLGSDVAAAIYLFAIKEARLPSPASTMSPHPDLERFFSLNSEWAKRVQNQEPEFFAKSASGQTPQVCVREGTRATAAEMV